MVCISWVRDSGATTQIAKLWISPKGYREPDCDPGSGNATTSITAMPAPWDRTQVPTDMHMVMTRAVADLDTPAAKCSSKCTRKKRPGPELCRTDSSICHSEFHRHLQEKRRRS